MMKKSCLFILLLILIVGCIRKTNKATGNTESLTEQIVQGKNQKENVPFHYNESGTAYSGAFAVSDDYFAELALNIETGKLTVLINGKEVPCELSIPEDPEVFLPALCITVEDLNGDGCMDFALTPNCTARFPESYVHLFDTGKGCFVAFSDNNDEKEPSI